MDPVVEVYYNLIFLSSLYTNHDVAITDINPIVPMYIHLQICYENNLGNVFTQICSR